MCIFSYDTTPSSLWFSSRFLRLPENQHRLTSTTGYCNDSAIPLSKYQNPGVYGGMQSNAIRPSIQYYASNHFLLDAYSTKFSIM